MDRLSETYKEFLETVLEQVDGTIVSDYEGRVVYLIKIRRNVRR